MSSPIAEPPEPTARPDEPQAAPEPLPATEPSSEPTEPAGEPMAESLALEPYDAVLVLSFGGPEGEDEVMPFLRRVTGGRDIPDERLAEVAEHYYARGGRSPINGQSRALQQSIRAELRRRGFSTPVLIANRNSEPFLPDVFRGAQDSGAGRLLVVTTSGTTSPRSTWNLSASGPARTGWQQQSLSGVAGSGVGAECFGAGLCER